MNKSFEERKEEIVAERILRTLMFSVIIFCTGGGALLLWIIYQTMACKSEIKYEKKIYENKNNNNKKLVTREMVNLNNLNKIDNKTLSILRTYNEMIIVSKNGNSFVFDDYQKYVLNDDLVSCYKNTGRNLPCMNRGS